MAMRAGDLTKRVDRLENEMITVAAAVDKLAEHVSDGFREQREYTKHAFLPLLATVERGFARMDGGFKGLAARLDQLTRNAR